MQRRLFGKAIIVFSIAWIAAVCVASPADELAEQIKDRVNQSVKALNISTAQPANLAELEPLAVTASWKELWPDAKGSMVSRDVEAKVWNAPIQAALARHGSVFLPRCGKPYYINDPIVLKSGQRLVADREAEIRLVPGTNTCMVRNEHIVSGQNAPIPTDARPDAHILIEGGIWTTLATGPEQSNGNGQGWPAKGDTTIPCHGVILLSNVRGVVVRNLVVRQSRVHAVQLSNCRDFLVEGLRFDEHRRDGVHVNGPASYGVIRNIRGITYDDFIALNAWDWSNTVPCFGSIDHVLVEDIHCIPRRSEIRLLPGTKTFSNGRKLDCPVADCVLRNLHDVATFKIYDQPNHEVGRDIDYCDPIGTVRNVYFNKLVFNSLGRFQIAANVERLSIDDVQVNLSPAAYGDFKLVEIGPMSITGKPDLKDAAAWNETFLQDRDVIVRNFRLTNVRVKTGDGIKALPNAEASLVKIADQESNSDHPETKPRDGKGRVIVTR